MSEATSSPTAAQHLDENVNHRPRPITRETLSAWLNDALAMENALISILHNHAEDPQLTPAARRRFARHIEQTARHVELVSRCIRQFDGASPAPQAVLGTMFGAMQSFYTGVFGNKTLRNLLMDYGTAHFEIACHRGLQLGAESLGQWEIAATCGAIIQDEREMAEWLYGELIHLFQDTGDASEALAAPADEVR